MFALKVAGVRLWVALAAALMALSVAFFASANWDRPAEAEERKAPSNYIKYETDIDWPEPEATRDPQIVGGTAVPNGKYPFVAFIRFFTNQGSFRCTGTLIDRNTVLTAAHCVTGTTGAQVTLGRAAISNTGQGQVRSASAAIFHRLYTGRNFAYDAAVLQLRGDVSGIRPAIVANANHNGFETRGRLVTTAGWGAAREGATSFPDRMREVRIPIRSDAEAQRAYASTGDPELRYFPSLMVAAGQRGKDACQGDSGGPLFVPSGGSHIQIGITSYGLGCARAKYPGVWTEVNNANIRGFIVNNANANN